MDESSMLARRSLIGLDEGMMRSRNTTIPKPPMKWVELLQKRRLSGSDSMFSRMVAPVVVKPETLSNHAFEMVNGPPHRAYGSIPKMKESNQDRTMMT